MVEASGVHRLIALQLVLEQLQCLEFLSALGPNVHVPARRVSTLSRTPCNFFDRQALGEQIDDVMPGPLACRG